MPSRPNVSKKRDEVNCVPLSVVSVTFTSRLPSGSRPRTACSIAASASSVRQRCDRFQPTISRVQQEGGNSIKLQSLGIDLAKNIFHLVGLDSSGRVVI